MSAPAPSAERAWPWFLAWVAVGAGGALAILGALTIGIFVLPVPLILAVLLARSRRASQGMLGIVSGLGLPVLYVAYLNRDGPGTICTTTRTSESCTQESNPALWAAIGLTLVVGGALAFMVRRRYERDRALLQPR